MLEAPVGPSILRHGWPQPMSRTVLASAFAFALEVHGGQLRKGLPVPFVAHLLAVSGLVLEFGGDLETGAAALLHDTLEDTPTRTEELTRKFGARIAGLVVECSDNLEPDQPELVQRKERYLVRIPTMSADALLIVAADKLHNARSVVREVRALGEDAFRPFRLGKEGTLWYYRSALEGFDKALDARQDLIPGFRSLTEDLRREVATLDELVGAVR